MFKYIKSDTFTYTGPIYDKFDGKVIDRSYTIERDGSTFDQARRNMYGGVIGNIGRKIKLDESKIYNLSSQKCVNKVLDKHFEHCNFLTEFDLSYDDNPNVLDKFYSLPTRYSRMGEYKVKRGSSLLRINILYVIEVYDTKEHSFKLFKLKFDEEKGEVLGIEKEDISGFIDRCY